VKRVPEGFLWGVAIASHQNDGGAPASDWTAAEQAGVYPHRSGEGTRFRTLYEQDLDLIANDLGANALRTSIEWARIEPTPGVWDDAEVAYLHGLFAAARARGIRVIATLHHFTSPAWLHQGPRPSGWEAWPTADLFARYARFIAREFRGEIDFYLTFNEPSNLLLGAYASGMLPPFRRGPLPLIRATRVMHHAHTLAYAAIHAEDPTAQVSLTEFSGVLPLWPRPLLFVPGQFLAWLLPRKPLPLDFISLHYYGDVSFADMSAFPARPDRFDTRPDYFTRALISTWKAFKLPILIGENGLATRPGEPRRDGWTAPRYLVAHVEAMQAAMDAGVPILGYLWWTLTDNYEWGTFDTRFGLYRVECLKGDYTREPTPTVATYREIIAAGGVPSSDSGTTSPD
jgi:beta-glucosidase